MSEFNRNYGPPLVVFFFIAIALVLSGYNDGQQVGQGDAAYDPTTQETQHTESHLPRGGISVSSPPSAVEADQTANRTEYRQQQDLEAQWQMADWTKIMGIAAIVAAGLTVVGLFLIGMTLSATQKAAGHAKTTAEAAKATVDVTREMGQAQVKAYIHATSCDIGHIPNSKDCFMHIMLKNFGNTPGIRVRFVVERGREHWLYYEQAGKFIWPKYHQPVGTLIKGGDATPIRFKGPLNNEIKYLEGDETGAVHTVVRGAVRYEDVFGNTIESQIAFQHHNGAWREIDSRPERYVLIEEPKKQKDAD